MKAKDYAKRYRESEIDKDLEISGIALDFLQEIFTLVDARHAKTDSAISAIMDEQDNKWKAFARELPEVIIPNGFAYLVKAKMPDMYDAWMLTRKTHGWVEQHPITPSRADIDRAWLTMVLGRR
jgi:hypothetical protein